VNVGTYDPPDHWPEPTVDETVDEAVMIVAVAVRLALKNLIIVRALQERADYSEARLLAATREEILNYALEKEADAARVDRQHQVALTTRGQPTSLSDFRLVDAPTLARKAEVLRVLATRVRALADDEDFAARLIAAARDEALEEVLGAFALPSRDVPRDDAERAARRKLVAGDLESLMIARQLKDAENWDSWV
jgi:hypothetical protein